MAQPARPPLAEPTEPTELPDSGPRVRTPTGSTVYPPGKYRISISGFTVNHQTDDDFLQLDGKGDEVYFSIQILKTDPSGTLNTSWQASKLVETPVIGDKNGFPDRIAAGSASDLGGLRTGDQVRLPTPFVLWEGTLSGGLLITPTVWEWDGPIGDKRRLEIAWKRRMKLPDGSILSQFSPYGGPSSFGSYPTIRAAGYQELTRAPCSGCFISEHTDIISCGLFCGDPLESVNRPIGVNMSSGFRPGAVRLGYQNLEAGLAGKNVMEFPIQYQDNRKGSGDYTIVLRLERIM
jgi:hypothetical protein